MRESGSAPWSLIGVGAVIVLAILTIVVVSLKLAFDAGLPGTALDIPSTAELPPPADGALRLDQEEPVACSLAELTALAGAGLSDWVKAGSVGPGSRVLFEAAGPEASRVRARISFELPASAGTWISGRFVNLDVTFLLRRENGADAIFEVDRYQYGGLDAVAVGDPPGLVERLKVNGRIPAPAWEVWERLKHFTHRDDQVTVHLSPAG